MPHVDESARERGARAGRRGLRDDERDFEEHGRLMREGLHPATMWAADPHSTYMGTLSELGVAGAAALALLAAALVADARWWRKRRRGRMTTREVVLGTAILYVGLEAVTIDVMSFRHYWVAVALVAAISAASRTAVPTDGAGALTR